MRSLVITGNPLWLPVSETSGLARRFSTFVRAIVSISSEVKLLHIGPSTTSDTDFLSRHASDHFGFPIQVALVGLRARPKTFRNSYLGGLSSIFNQPGYYGFTGNSQVDAVSRALTNNPDLVFVHRLGPMTAMLRSHGRSRRLFFDLDDVEHWARLRSAFHPPFWPGKLFYAAHALAVAAAERQAASIARATFVCSKVDCRHLARIGIRSRIVVIPNAVALPDCFEPVAAEPSLMFIGSYGYPPNQLAAQRLIQRIWPLVRSRRPDARLLIAGMNAELLPGYRQPEPGVDYVGFVDDLACLYARSRVVCCPVTLGSGTRVKLVEAAGFAKPIVSTRLGAEGLAFVDGADILIRDDDAGFADACLRLLEDDVLCRKLGLGARARMESLYDAAVVQSRIASIMTDSS